MSAVEVHAARDIPREQVQEARERIAEVERYVDEGVQSVRLTLRRGAGRSKRPWVADASVVWDGRVLAAHTAGASPAQAAEDAADRLRRQLRRTVGADVALRDEPRVIARALADLEPDRENRPEASLKPPEEREIVHRATYPNEPQTTLEAVAELLDRDMEFNIFVHARTREDVVVYRRDDGKTVGLIHPPGSELADENELVVPEPSRYLEPLTLVAARDEMDVLNHRFLYFTDSDDGRGKVIYLRHDGNYGLVEPESE